MESLLTAIGLVFLAELGDKTQLVAAGLGARHGLRPVLAGLVLGYGAVNLVSVSIGAALGAAFPERPIGIASGLLFIGFALWTVRDQPDAHQFDDAAESGSASSPLTDSATGPVVLSVAGAMFVAELGDKTMLATATLAADGDPVLVWIGATIGIVLSGLLGVLVGRTVGARLPERAVRLGSAALFALFGVALIVTNL